MKPQTLSLAALAAAALLAGCSGKKAEAPAEPAAAAAEESRVKHGANGEVIVTVDAATQKTMGLQTAALELATLSAEAAAYGRVLDVTPLTVLAAELATAQAAAEASERELARLKTLTAQSNATERALDAAVAAVARDRAQVDSARLRLLGGWGKAVADRQDLPALLRSLAALQSALVQLEVPLGPSLKAAPESAVVFPAADESAPLAGEFLGPAPQVDPQMQGRGFLFLVASNTAGLAPGASVSGRLRLPGEPGKGWRVPSAAILRHDGARWVYRQAAEDKFERREVTLDQPVAGGWLMRAGEGWTAQDKIVITGAQQLLSEEFKGQGE